MRILVVTFTLALISLTLAVDPCAIAAKQCAFEFYQFPGKIPVFSVNSPPDQAFTPRIVSKNPQEVIGVLNTNGVIPEFIKGKFAFPITKFADPRFTPTHFKPFPIPSMMGSGVGHETFQGNQKSVASGQCVRVFFTMFQKLVGEHPPQVENVVATRNDFKCVVFRLK